MSKRLLAVDDVESTLTVISTVFLNEFEVVKKCNGVEALKWLYEGNIPEAIITDLRMPEMNGFDFISHLKAIDIFRYIPILVLSGSDIAGDRLKALQLGADEYLSKPFNVEELKIRTNNMIECRSFRLLLSIKTSFAKVPDPKRRPNIIRSFFSMFY